MIRPPVKTSDGVQACFMNRGAIEECRDHKSELAGRLGYPLPCYLDDGFELQERCRVRIVIEGPIQGGRNVRQEFLELSSASLWLTSHMWPDVSGLPSKAEIPYMS